MNIFVGCSASRSIKDMYISDCSKFLRELMRDNNLIFGACRSGLMGVVYDITKEYGNKVIGVCPDAYKNDFLSLECDNEIVTPTINSRTEGLFKNCDAIVFIPGGIGSVYELFSAIECKRCHEFDKPIVIYNSCGYYDKLLEFLEVIYEEGFASKSDKDFYFVSNSSKEVLGYINNYNKNGK